MADAGIHPNSVSYAGIVFTFVGASLLVISPRIAPVPAALCLFIFPLFVTLRSVCNLIDGMIAVEGGKQTPSGEIYNDFPDRVSDPLMFIAAGYAIISTHWGVAAGWAAALASVIVAYTRMLGGAAGAKQYFTGPMAKTHRMLVISLASLAAGIERLTLGTTHALLVGLIVIIVGCIVTVARRLRRITRELESR